MARAASASVSADVTLRPLVRTALRASAFRSRSAATNALDSMYRTLVERVCGAVCSGGEGPTRGLRLRFATVSGDQFGSGSGRQANIRPVLRRVTRFERWPNHSGRHEFVESARRIRCLCARWDKLRDHATVSRNGYTFAGFDPPDVTAQVVLELPDTCGGHNQLEPHVATFSNARQIRVEQRPPDRESPSGTSITKRAHRKTRHGSGELSSLAAAPLLR